MAYVTFLVLDIPFEVILSLPWLLSICSHLDWGTRELNV